MKNNNILIWSSFEIKSRQGGPSTYLYNLKESVIINNIKNIFFADLYQSGVNESDFKESYTVVKQKKYISIFINSKIKPIINFIRNKKKKENKKLIEEIVANHLVQKKIIDKKINLNDFTHIHFHTTCDYFQYKEELKNYKGKILLTSHSPKAFHKELVEDVLNIESKKESQKYTNQLKVIDEFAFKNADYIIFPCREAQEPYFNSWKDYKSIINKDKIIELITCCPKSEVLTSVEKIKQQFNIPLDSFIITYTGRHNSVKGFDLLKDFAQSIFKNNDNVYFLIAGKEYPLKGLNHDNWIEVGWTEDPHSIINAGDLHVLPNKETYFDLALLEVLSLNKRLLISETGGNKYFKKLPETETKDIHFFNIEEGVKSMMKSFQFIYDEKNKACSNNSLYQKYFSNDTFALKYIKMIETL